MLSPELLGASGGVFFTAAEAEITLSTHLAATLALRTP